MRLRNGFILITLLVLAYLAWNTVGLARSLPSNPTWESYYK